MGRSRGGLATKPHALVDGNGAPVVLKLTEVQAHDGKSAFDMLGSLGRGQVLPADRAYDRNVLREKMETQGVWTNILPMSHRKNPPVFCNFTYRYRNTVERFFSKIKHYRAIASRYEKHDANFLALIKIVSARICISFMSL